METPPFVRSFLKLLVVDIILISALPFLVYMGPIGWLALLWLLLAVPFAYGALVPQATQWVNEQCRAGWASALTKFQCAGGLWFLIWATVFYCLADGRQDYELWQMYLLAYCFLQLFRMSWFGYANIIALTFLPFFGNRLDKLCMLSGALSSGAALYLWSTKGQLPPLPPNAEQVPFFIFIALGSVVYGLSVGGAVHWLVSYFRPPTEGQTI